MTDKALLRVLAGETLDVPPVWLMRQAGRYLPEYKATRAEAGSFLDLCYRPDLAEEVTLQPIRRYGFDAAILFADILLVPQGMGQKLWFAEGEGPRFDPITHEDHVTALNPDAIDDTVAPVYETVARLSKSLPNHVTLIGFAGSPWTVASYMVAGRGTPDQAPAKQMAYKAPELFAQLMDKLVTATIHYLDNQVKAGAEVLQLFDTWAGSLSEPLFDLLVIEPTRKIVEALKQKHPSVPIIGFPRAAGVHLPRYKRLTGVDAVGLDTTACLDFAATEVQPLGAVQGNLDPLLLMAGGQQMADEVKRIKTKLGNGPHIFNLGHGIVPQTPPEHVGELVELIRKP